MTRTFPRQENSRISEIESILSKRPKGEYIPDQRRSALESLTRTLFDPDMSEIAHVDMGGVDCCVLNRADAAEEYLLYLHGGAFCIGSCAAYGHVINRLAELTNRTVVFVNYRLAPEHRHPAAVEDCFSVYAHLLESGRTPDKCVVVGDSAGAALGLALCAQAKEKHLPLPARNVFISPWVNLELSHPSVKQRAIRDKFLVAESLRACARFYLGDAEAAQPGHTCFFSDLYGFPQTLIQVGSEEILFDDARWLHEQLAEAGVLSTLEIWDGMCHVWPFFFPILDEGERALRGIADFIGQD